MNQIKGSREFSFQLPIISQEVVSLKAGDLVYLSGTICSGRDHFHKRIISHIKKGISLPKMFQEISGSAIYHMGPIVKKKSENEENFEIIAGGPTTSARMNKFQEEVCKELQIPFVIGKGGMQGVKWIDIPAVYLQYPGGTGALTTKFIKRIVSVEWLDLGTPEAAWFLEVEKFGPLVVGIDTHGNSLYK